MVRKLRFQTGLSENCVFGPPGEPVFSKILKNYFFMISFISFNDIITFLKHLGKMTFLRLYLPLTCPISRSLWAKTHCDTFRNLFPCVYVYLHWLDNIIYITIVFVCVLIPIFVNYKCFKFSILSTSYLIQSKAGAL